MSFFNKAKKPQFEQLGIIGCGLMGSSFALAMRRAGLVKRIVGYSKSPSTTARAMQLRVIDVEAASALQAVSGSDVVLIAVPVAAIEGTFKAIKHMVTTDMLIMDVGSTKSDVVDASQRILGSLAGCFVPAHPIAGKERSGVEHADANLYTGRKVILTPVAQTLTAQITRAEAIWSSLGCQVEMMSPEAHDTAFAAVSHLPHLLAFAMMNSITTQRNADDFLALAGSGFRDFTRIAASDPEMWHDIFMANRVQMTLQIDQFRQTLDLMSSMIAQNDSRSLEASLTLASATRKRWHLANELPAK